jgi:F-type H+-transporting ATPase subunit delta
LSQKRLLADSSQKKKKPTTSESAPPTSQSAPPTSQSAPPTSPTSSTPQTPSPPTQTELDLDISPFKLDQTYASPLRFEGHTGKLAANLFIYAGKANERDKVLSELVTLQDLLKKDPKFHKMVLTPTANYTEYEKQWKEALQSIKASPYLFAVFKYLYENRKLNERFLRLLTERYSEMIKNLQGLFEGEFISPQPVPERSLAYLTKKFSQMYLKPGQTLQLKTRVQPDLLGGYILKIGINTYDLSHAAAARRAAKTKESTLKQYSSALEDSLKQVHPLIG